jgi:nucleoside-diphosphate kinase
MIEQTLVLVKPDGVARGLSGEIIKRFEQRGLKIIALKMVKVQEDHSKKHYAEHLDKEFYKSLEEYITSGPVVAMIIEGVAAVENVRKLCGTTESKTALPGTIRGDFTHMSYAYADGKGIPLRNIIHASGNKEDAEKEIALWFALNEISDYKRTSDTHIF